jgi:hypothetical protein
LQAYEQLVSHMHQLVVKEELQELQLELVEE